MQKNTEPKTKKQRRKEVWKNVINITVWHGLSAFAMLYLRFAYVKEGGASIALLVFALLELAFISPFWLTLKGRLREIEESDEDAAA